MRRLIILLLLLAGPGLLLAQSRGKQKKADQQTAAWRYEIENLGMVATATASSRCGVMRRIRGWRLSRPRRMLCMAFYLKGLPMRVEPKVVRRWFRAE